MTVAHGFHEPLQDHQDSVFCCVYCEKAIEENEPVYMCRDASYCSATCRRKGRRVQMTQIQFARAASGSVLSTIDSAVSDSSCSSSAASREPRPAAQGGILKWLLGKVGRKLASMVEGTELLRSVSSQGFGGFGGAGLGSMGDTSADRAGAHFGSGMAGLNDRHLEEFRRLESGDDMPVRTRLRSVTDSATSSDFARLIEGR